MFLLELEVNTQEVTHGAQRRSNAGQNQQSISSSKSLLRYPGGKLRAVNQLLPFFAQQPGILCSPFFGGGSLEIALAVRGWQVHGYEAFGLLVDFWQCTLITPSLLADE